MDQDSQIVTEHTSLLHHGNHNPSNRLQTGYDEEAQSVISSGITKDELQMAGSIVGERLPYNDYTTIDWLHDLVKDSYRSRTLISHRNLCNRLLSKLEASSGWLAVILIGSLTACVAFIVDIGVATVSDWKIGYCTRNPLLSREACCRSKAPLVPIQSEIGGESNGGFRTWSDRYGSKFAVYVLFALAFGTISSSATMLTKRSLSAASPSPSSSKNHANNTLSPEETRQEEPLPSIAGKTMYMAAGSGIPEIKTILSGFVIPNFLSPTVLLVKAFGAVFAVSTGMWLGKEGPFVHISTCIGSIVGQWFPKYCDNGRKMRELLSAACAAGLSVAFGAPIGGVLFSYEEISTYFPRKVLWRAFLCSLSAAIILKTLNPTGTGKLVLFETNYGTSYSAIHYLAFILLGVAGGIFGGIFCAANFLWSRWFRSFSLIKNNPVLEVLLVVLVTAIVQFPNPLTREPGDTIIKNLLVDCQDEASLASSYVCAHESKFRSGTDGGGTDWGYIGMLTHGTLTKLGLTIITFGIKVPSGVIIPSLDAGAFFGRLVGQLHFLRSCISPGIFAMVGSAAFLAGVSRMTISLCVIMFELTGSLEYVVPHMVAILVAKWVADSISGEGVYDLAQTVLGHPFLDSEHALEIVRRGKGGQGLLVKDLLSDERTKRTMGEITVEVQPRKGTAPQTLLQEKLARLKERGLMDAGLVIVQQSTSSTRVLQGYIFQPELEFGLSKLCPTPSSSTSSDIQVRLLPAPSNAETPELEIDLSPFVDRTRLTVSAKAPMEYAVEMFSKLGLRYLCVVDYEKEGEVVGVVLKKRLVGFLEGLKGDGKKA